MELIKGTYGNNDALRIISDLIEVKIKYHTEKISQSDTEEDVKMRESRIKELQKDLSSIKQYLTSFDDILSIKAQIHINRKNESSPSFKLIDGVFSPAQAKQILHDAYRSKITFHTNNAFSKAERGEVGVEMHEKRIEELKKDMEVLNKILQGAENTGSIVSVSCKIDIHVEEPQLQLSKQALGYSN